MPNKVLGKRNQVEELITPKEKKVQKTVVENKIIKKSHEKIKQVLKPKKL